MPTGPDPRDGGGDGRGRDAGSGTSWWPAWASTAATVVSPIAVTTALLFYFGWVRADAQARELGYDVALLRLSTTDYVLRSINVLYFPIIALLVAGLVALMLHRRVVGWLTSPGQGRRRHALLAIGSWAWGWLPVVLAVVIAARSPDALVFAVPFLLTAGVAMAVYAHRLRLRLRVADRSAPGPLWTGLVSCLVVVLLFWDVQRIASAFGTEYAEYVKHHPDEFPAVAVLSQRPLNMDGYAVQESDAGNRVAHRYRYDGFWLMNYANERYLLLARTDQDRTVLVVVPDATDIQLAFSSTG